MRQPIIFFLLSMHMHTGVKRTMFGLLFSYSGSVSLILMDSTWDNKFTWLIHLSHIPSCIQIG